MSFADFLAQSRTRVTDTIENALTQQQSPFAKLTHPALERLRSANIYSISNGGKRLRPALVYAVCESFGTVSEQDQNLIAAAIE